MTAVQEEHVESNKQALAYERPVIEDHGDLTEITAASQTGSQTDASFPAGTPQGDITFTTP